MNWSKYIGDKTHISSKEMSNFLEKIDGVYARRVKRIVRVSKRKETIKRLFGL